MAEKEIPKPFNFGDVVKKVKKTSWFCVIDEEHIITQIEWSQGEWEYGTNHSAWHDHESFELVRESDQESLRQMVDSLEEDEEIW